MIKEELKILMVEDNPEGVHRAYGFVQQVITPIGQVVGVEYTEPCSV